jgi:23S rRNA (guanosine2251-2'-O)-methyltransferase
LSLNSTLSKARKEIPGLDVFAHFPYPSAVESGRECDKIQHYRELGFEKARSGAAKREEYMNNGGKGGKSGSNRRGDASGKRQDRPDASAKRGGQAKPWKQASYAASVREPAEDVCWGRQPVLDLARNAPGRCAKIVIANNVRPPFLDELVDAARAGKIVYQMTAPEALDALCPGARHQGVACRVTEVRLLELEPFLNGLPRDKPALIVVLDHIEDPHNLGAIVRSAEAAGAAAVVVSKRRSALPGGTVVKVSAGAAMRVPIISVVNIARSVEQLKEAGFWTIGLENAAETSLWAEAPPWPRRNIRPSRSPLLFLLLREEVPILSHGFSPKRPTSTSGNLW